jgi:hypothetical protein
LRPVYLTSLALLCVLFTGIGAEAQSTLDDSSFYRRSLDTLEWKYRGRVKTNLRIYNGNEYSQYGLRVKGNPYFMTDSLTSGDLFYDGTLYHGVRMHYDLVYDDIIVEDYSGSFPIKMLAHKIDYFALLDHVFVHFIPDSAESTQKPAAFFDLIYSGPIVNVYVKRQKRLEMPLDPTDNTPAYNQYDTYYLTINHNVSEVGDIKELINVLKDRKDEMKKFAKTNGIKLKEMSDESVKRMVAYYSSLKN